jgi:D-glycero-alpha-D-manno-heptose-7-phosphate kinase
MIYRSKAPLRLGLAGGGTDLSPYCDKYVGYILNATISMYVHCTIEVTDSNKISMYEADKNELFKCDSKELLELDGRLDLHKGIYNHIVKNYNNNTPLSFNMTTYSDVPAGSGLGSSSTMVVAILRAFAEWLNIPFGEYDLAYTAYIIERHEIGLSGGKQDQYAATFGGFNFMEFYSEDKVLVNPLRIKNWTIDELEASLVLYYMGASRSSTKIIDDQIKNAVTENKVSIQAMHQIKADAFATKEAILRGDFKSFAEIIGKTWESKKKTARAVSNSEMDRIYNIALNAGAYSGKVSGAGGGGFMMFVVDPIKKINVIKALEECGGEVKPFNFVKIGTCAWQIK